MSNIIIEFISERKLFVITSQEFFFIRFKNSCKLIVVSR